MINYKKKILTVDKLVKVIGKFPRKKNLKVAMCHGVFDLVHPGHIRHLSFAKSKTNKLIVSITSDYHIKKAELRPYVPQNLRAENLAALEFVDYVIIDSNETPLKNISKIKPDYFVKGYEYVKGNEINPKTNKEIKILNNYGGRFLFTPGDYVLSSSKILSDRKPNLAYLKLKNLMDGEKISFSDILKNLENFKNLNVTIVGDTIIDTYVRTQIIGNNAKTPTFSTKYLSEKNYIGGAAIVAMHLKAAGANVKFCSVTGDDALGRFTERELKKYKIKTNIFKDNSRPTTEKKYFISDNDHLLKVDNVENSPLLKNFQNKISNFIKKQSKGMIIFSDFRHGIFNKESIPLYIKSIKKGVFKVADSQVASRWGNILDFKKFDLITPNEKQARFSMGDQDTALRPLASKLYDKAKCKTLMLKLGSKGSITLRRKMREKDFRSFFVLDALEKNPFDTVGCGDAFLSYAAPGVLLSKSSVIGSILGTISSSIATRIEGNRPITNKEVKKKIFEIKDICKVL